jgi:hypothetical protein
MKLFKITLLIMSVLFIQVSEAQVKKSRGWKSPTFTIDITPIYAMPMNETKGANIGEFFTFKNYGTKLGWGALFNFKFGAGKQGQYRPYLTLGYVQFQAKDDNNAYIPRNIIDNGYPLRNDSIFNNPVAGQSEIFIRVPHIGAGFEYAFTNVDRKKRMWYPHIGVEMLLSVVTGIYRQTSPNVLIEPNVETGYTIKSDVRVGVGGALGATIRFGKVAGITFGGKYKLYNLIGKKSDFLKEENKMNLLDKKAEDLNTNLSKDRNIGSLEFYLGATLFFGKTKK